MCKSKVAILINSLDYGGAERVVSTILNYKKNKNGDYRKR